MNQLALSAGRCRTQNVTLTGIISTARALLCSAITATAGWLRCNAAPLNILRAVFGPSASMAIITACMLAVWFHYLTIDNADAQDLAVGRDMAAALPWVTVWSVRAFISEQKGGEQ